MRLNKYLFTQCACYVSQKAVWNNLNRQTEELEVGVATVDGGGQGRPSECGKNVDTWELGKDTRSSEDFYLLSFSSQSPHCMANSGLLDQ